MPIEVTMPRLSDTMQQGTIVKWQVKEGQKVKSGDVIADIETDKATMELQSYDDGTVAKLAVAEGQTVTVGTLIVVLAGAGEDASSIKAPSNAGAAAATKAGATVASSTNVSAGAPAATTAVAEPPESGNGVHSAANDRVLVSPLARKIADDSGVDLSSIQGTGPGGRIVRKDVEAAISVPGVRAAPPKVDIVPAARPAAPLTPAPAPIPGAARLTARTVALSNMRRTIASRLVLSKTTIPHYQVTVEADMDALMSLRAQLNEQLTSQGVKLSINDFLVRAC